MQLKPQDLLFLLKLIAIGKNPWSFNKLALGMDMSPSEVHAAANRALAAMLAVRHETQIRPHVRNLSEFIKHGVRYVFVPDRGPLERGIPTGISAPPLSAHFANTTEPVHVWPHPEGTARGESFSPLYKSAPAAAMQDPALYQLLALLDAVRGGRARERQMAIQEITRRLEQYDQGAESQH